jgi:hypothetical protein
MEGRHYPACNARNEGVDLQQVCQNGEQNCYAIHKDFVDSFGDKAEDFVVTKLTLIGYGSRDQVAHYDQKPKDKQMSRE